MRNPCGGLHVVHGGLVADHVAFLGMLRPGLNAQRQAVGLAHEESALQGAARGLIAEEFEHAAVGGGLLPGEHPGGVGADLFLAGDGDNFMFCRPRLLKARRKMP